MGLRMAADAAATQSDTDEDAHDAFRRDLIQGLSRTQKAVPPKWFYDAEGSRLFEEITRLPEYYPTRQETALLRGTAGDLAAMFGPQAVLVEFGSGASEKTRILLDAAPDLAAYVPLPTQIDGAFLPRPAPQRYTCLCGERYRYEGLFRHFSTELAVDPDGPHAQIYRGIAAKLWGNLTGGPAPRAAPRIVIE